MKKILILTLTLLTILFMLSACNKQKPVTPNDLPDWAKDGNFLYSDQIGG